MTPLPETVTDEPLRAFKYAEIRGGTRPAVYPSGRFGRYPYEHRHTARATCHRRPHPAPALDCSCGFHGVGSISDLPHIAEHHDRQTVVLEVELGGMVVQHEHGLRAEEQTVLAVLFPARCARCGSPAELVHVGATWRSLCRACADRSSARVLNRAAATEALGVDVAFVDAHRTHLNARVLHVVRSVVILLCTILAAWVTLETSGARWAHAVTAGLVAASLVLTFGVANTGARRARTQLFLAQCAGLICASLVMATRT